MSSKSKQSPKTMSTGLSPVNCLLLLLALLIVAAGFAAVARGGEGGRHFAPAKPTKFLSVTFNELPVSESFAAADREHITKMILSALKKHEAPAAGFVVGDNIGEGFDLLGAWLNDGHVLGNLTQTHQDLHDIGIENFIREIQICDQALEPMLDGFGQKKRYFRFPFLHYGNSVESKRELRLFLDAMNKTIAHATILVEDYLYNLSLEKDANAGDSAALSQIGNDYLADVLEQVAAAEELSQKMLNRKCRQILLLRANLLNALVLDELLSALEEEGYGFIPLDEALQDELYSAPEAYYGSRGVGYLEMIMKSDPDLLPAQ
ncbi:MAG: polysaccharide deacetylase family protein [bacterium]